MIKRRIWTILLAGLLLSITTFGCVNFNIPGFSDSSDEIVAGKITMAIMVGHLSDKDAGYKQKAEVIISRLSMYLKPAADGKFSLKEAFRLVSIATKPGGSFLVDPAVLVIVQLAFNDYLEAYNEIPAGHQGKIEQLGNIVELVGRNLRGRGAVKKKT